MSERILVPFEGDGAGTAELTWGQRNIWIPIRRHRTSLPIGGVYPLASGISIGDIVAQLQFLLNRHQALRTRVEFDPENARDARQVLSSAGELPIEIVDSAIADHDPDKAAQAVGRRFWATEFDYPREWPVRCAVITHNHVPCLMVMAVCHLSVDAPGLTAMLADLLRIGEDRIGIAGKLAEMKITPSRGGRSDTLGMPPLEQARWQASPAGRRASERTLRHWEGIMSSVPARRFAGDCADPQEPRFWRASSRSDAAHLASHAIAGRLQARTAPVLFAAYAAAVARVTGSNPVLVQVLLSNRLRTGLANSVSPTVQPGIALVEFADVTFDQLVRDAWRSTMTASRHSYYDPYGQQALIDAMTERHGEEMQVRCFFNDRRVHSGPETIGPAPDPDQLAQARSRTTLQWGAPTDRSTEPFVVNVEHEPGTVTWTVGFDTHYLSPGRVEAFLREMEAILLSAAFDPDYAVRQPPSVAVARSPITTTTLGLDGFG
jgi:hypothetical protein